MAAPAKQGLDYFPVNVHLFRDRGLRQARKKHGYLAQVLYITLLQMLYADKGYYLDISDLPSVIWDIQETLFGELDIQDKQITDCIRDLVDGGCFDKNLYRSGILTSHSIQEVYYTATVRRRFVVVNPTIWLLTVEEMQQLSSIHSLVKDLQPENGDPEEGNGEADAPMASSCPQDASIYSQKKGKEKEKEIERERSGASPQVRERPATTTLFSSAEAGMAVPSPLEKAQVEAALYDYARNTGLADLPGISFFRKWLNRMEDGVLRYALDEAGAAPHPSSAYLCGILNGLWEEGCTTVEQLAARKKARDMGAAMKAVGTYPPPREMPGIHFGHERGPDSFHVVVNDWDAPI